MPVETGARALTTRVLLIEENAQDALLICQMLRRSWSGGLVVSQVEGLRDATEEMQAGGFACILAGLSGRESAADAIHRLRAGGQLAPIVVLADREDEDLALNALRAGAEDVLVKPYLYPAQLARAVKHAIERKRSEAKLAHQALHDQLTGLPNRALFLDRLTVALDRLRRSHDRIAVLFLDVDNFKEINDTLGHAAGDRVLAVLADRLRKMLRPTDTVARFGGDEFTFLFGDLDGEHEAALVAERISRIVSLPIVLDEGNPHVTVSIGLTTVSDADISPEAVIQQADEAMYRAKEAHRSAREGGEELHHRVALPGETATRSPAPCPSSASAPPPAPDPHWPAETAAVTQLRPEPAPTAQPLPPEGPAPQEQPAPRGEPSPPEPEQPGGSPAEPAEAAEAAPAAWGLAPEADRREAPDRSLLDALRSALERSELQVHYQPKVSLHDSSGVLGLEALVRWQHPERGLLQPSDFIDLAEQSGLIVPIGRYVVERALQELSQWRVRHPRVTISINISPAQLRDDGLPPSLREAIETARVEPEALCLEVPEHVLTDATPVQTLARVKALGVRVAVDHFGTGSSSLHELRRLPIDVLELDASLIGDVGRSAEQAALVGAMVELGHALGLRVAAEGVETEPQMAELQSLGCDEAQGFFFSRPVPAEQVEAILSVC